MKNVFSRSYAPFLIVTIPLVTGCVSNQSFDLLSGSSSGGLSTSTQSSDDPVASDKDNDAEQDADDKEDAGDGGLNKYSTYRSVFSKKVESIDLDVQRNFKLEGTGAAQKCIRERITLVGGLDFSHNLEVALRNCGGFLTAAAVKSANGGAACKESEFDVQRIDLPALSVRRVFGIRSDCVCYYGQRVETIALRVEKLRFARPTVCAEHFDEYKKIVTP